MEARPPTEAEVVEVATRIYQKRAIDDNLAGKAEEAALGVEKLSEKVTTVHNLVVSAVRLRCGFTNS